MIVHPSIEGLTFVADLWWIYSLGRGPGCHRQQHKRSAQRSIRTAPGTLSSAYYFGSGLSDGSCQRISSGSKDGDVTANPLEGDTDQSAHVGSLSRARQKSGHPACVAPR